MSDNLLDQEKRIQLAIAAINDKKVPSIRKAALIYDVPRTTLQDRFRGGQTHQIAAQHLQRLSPEEEDSIVKAIYQLDA